MNVATQLADLLAWLHKNKIAVGSIIASCIMIDKVQFKSIWLSSRLYISFGNLEILNELLYFFFDCRK